MGKVSIILVNYNGLRFNKACIDSLLLQTYTNFEIIFVDNASRDGSLEEVKKLYQEEIRKQKIIIVEKRENTGFTLGTNIGVEHTDKKAQYISLLNNDTTLPKNRLEELVKGIESDPKLGAISGMVLDTGHEEQMIEIYTIKKEVIINNIFGEGAIKKVSPHEIKQGIYYTPYPSCCAILYKKFIIEKPFPDFYFAYGEDTFFCRYILKKGYKLGVRTEAKVYHFGSGSFGKKPSNLKLFYGNRNQIINFLVFYKTSTILKLFPLFLITQTAHLFINAFRKRLWAKIKARGRIIIHIKTIAKLKKQIQKDTSISEKEFVKELSYKFSDNPFLENLSKIKFKIIEKMNAFFEFYLNCFFYKKS